MAGEKIQYVEMTSTDNYIFLVVGVNIYLPQNDHLFLAILTF